VDPKRYSDHKGGRWSGGFLFNQQTDMSNIRKILPGLKSELEWCERKLLCARFDGNKKACGGKIGPPCCWFGHIGCRGPNQNGIMPVGVLEPTTAFWLCETAIRIRGWRILLGVLNMDSTMGTKPDTPSGINLNKTNRRLGQLWGKNKKDMGACKICAGIIEMCWGWRLVMELILSGNVTGTARFPVSQVHFRVRFSRWGWSYKALMRVIIVGPELNAARDAFRIPLDYLGFRLGF